MADKDGVPTHLSYICIINSIFGLSCQKLSHSTNLNFARKIYELVILAVPSATFIQSLWSFLTDPDPFQRLTTIISHCFYLSFTLNIAFSSLYLKHKQESFKHLINYVKKNLSLKELKAKIKCSKFVWTHLTMAPIIINICLSANQMYSFFAYCKNEFESKDEYNKTTGDLTYNLRNKTYTTNLREQKVNFVVLSFLQMFSISKKYVHNSLLLLIILIVKEQIKHLRLNLPVSDGSGFNLCKVKNWQKSQQNISR